MPPRLGISQRLPCCGLLLRIVPLYFSSQLFVQGLLLSTGSEMAPIQFFPVHILQIRPLQHSLSWSWGTLMPKFSKGPFFPSGSPQTHTMQVITPALPLFLPVSCFPAPGATDLCHGFQTCLLLGSDGSERSLKVRVWLSLALPPLQFQKEPWNFSSWGCREVTGAVEGQSPPRVRGCTQSDKKGRWLRICEAGSLSGEQRHPGWGCRQQGMTVRPSLVQGLALLPT